MCMFQQDDFVIHAARITALQNELARAREEMRRLEDDKRHLEDDKRHLEGDKRQLENDLKAMTREHSSTQEQYSLMQDLYTRASETTMRLNRENEELREEKGKMSEQLGVGLKQKDLFYEAIIDAKDHELGEIAMQRDLLVEQASRTGDVIREKAGRLPLVEAERNDALARIAACALCRKLASQSDEDSDYNPTQEAPVVPDITGTLRARRNQVPEPEEAQEIPEKKLHGGESRLHASPDEWEQDRKQYPLNSLERWKRPPNRLFPPVQLAKEKHFDLDIESVNMVYMCRWRPAHGNVCGALFANREVSRVGPGLICMWC
jgi:chromosome segregation ATPase